MAAPLKINASDLLGKLHVAALDKVNSKYKGAWNILKKAVKGRIVKSSIENTAFDEKTQQMNIPPDGKAKIRVVAAGTGAKNEAKEMFALYMKWFAGIEEDVTKFVKDAGDSDSGVSGKDMTLGGQGVFDLTIEYQLIATEKAAGELKDFANKTSKTSDASNDNKNASDDSDVINANESEEEQATKKKKVWESHPFELLFKETQEEPMVTESKAERFVDEVMKNDNVKAQNALESILKDKVEKRVRETLEDFKIASERDSKKNS